MTPAPVDLRLIGGLVVPVTAPPIDGGCVEVRGDRIVHVGAAPSGADAAHTVDTTGLLVLPAFVNTHCHTSQQLGRGLADDVDLLTWLHDRIWPYEAALTEADSEVSALACAVEQIRNGVTLLADPGGQHVDGMARGIERSGIRAILGRSTMDESEGVPEPLRESTAMALEAQDDLVARWHGAAGGRLRVGYTLRTIFNCSDALITATAERAERHDTNIQMHVAEVPEENAHSLRTRGRTTLRHLGHLGVLGPRFLAVHAVWLDDDELDLLAATGTPVSHNAASNLKILGTPRIADMLDRGVVVGIGTDGAPSNNRMSVIDELWLATITQKGLRRDPTVLPAAQALRMATIDGARALGLAHELGSLEAGKAADVLLVDPMTVGMVPRHDPVSAVVTSMRAENVHSLLCAGRWVLRDRVVVTVDERALVAEADARGLAVARRARIVTGA